MGDTGGGEEGRSGGRLRVVKTVFFGKRCFCTLPKTGGFDEKWRK